MATITDVSKRAGVSRSTVSRVVADNGYVSEAKRRAIEAAIAELGYRPNTLAQALRSNRSNMIGAVVVDVGASFYAEMVGGIQTTCRGAGKSLMVSSGFAEQDEEAKAILELVDRSCDGLVLYLEHPIRADVEAILAQAAIPVVLIGSESAVARGSVLIDNQGGAAAALRCLLDRGHRNIVHLSGQLAYRDTRSRLEGMAAILPEFGLTLADIHIVNGEYSERFGYTATTSLLADGHAFTAIFAGDDFIAAGALQALKSAGRRVPDEISLVGFDDVSHARHLTPALTTIRQPIDMAGHKAAELLLRLLAEPLCPPLRAVIKTNLILRDSAAHVHSQREEATQAF